MKKLSTGQDSTYKNWILLSKIFFGEDSKSTKWLEKKAEESPNGLKEEVIADEGQLLIVLMKINTED